ncbi:hypothetical protein LTR17_009496 [Elasticomyces elasticus]|nr:hypothetical protein LTR17_009496 [Elasticomyces elasticus]
MAPVIWGLDLAEFKWSKFNSKYMFGNRDYHLRRTKFAVYQCALIFCVVSESLGTAVLSDYIQMERKIQTIDHTAHVYNNDYVGAGSYNIFAGVFVAFIFGAAFFFDLIWPERYESQGVRWAWKICGVLATVFHLASALTLTVITATHRSRITGVSPARATELLHMYSKYREAPLIYRHNGRAVAAVVFVWLGWVSVAASCVLLFLSINNVEKGPGPKSAHAEGRETAHRRANHDEDPELATSEKTNSIQEPELTHGSEGINNVNYTASPAAEHETSR